MTSKKKTSASTKKSSAKKTGEAVKKLARTKKVTSTDTPSRTAKSKPAVKKKSTKKSTPEKSVSKLNTKAGKKAATSKKNNLTKGTKVKEEISKKAKRKVSGEKEESKKAANITGGETNGAKVTKKNGSVSKPKFVYKPNPSLLDAPQEGNNTPGRRYSDADLKEFKELILKKLEAARKEVNYLQGLITRKGEASTDDTENKYMSIEDGSGTMEREQLSQLASRQIQYIDHLEKALMRIENKTYGICRVTGKLIDKARLRAVPHATLSIEAKQKMNK